MKSELSVKDPMDRTDQAALADRTPGLAEPGCRTVPLPAGRFLIDLPAEACVRFGRQGFNEAGAFIQTLAVLGSLRRRENFSRYLRLPAPFRSSLSL
jgi:hypothetical protein